MLLRLLFHDTRRPFASPVFSLSIAHHVAIRARGKGVTSQGLARLRVWMGTVVHTCGSSAALTLGCAFVHRGAQVRLLTLLVCIAVPADLLTYNIQT